MEETKREVLKEEYEKIASEVEGKSEEELEEMKRKANETIYQAQIEEASKYVFNILELGPEYSEDAFTEALRKLDEGKSVNEIVNHTSLHTQFDKNEFSLGLHILNIGYLFGKDFISNVVDKDPESAKRLLEILYQDYDGLIQDINFINSTAYNMLEEKKKAESKVKEENK